MVWKANDLWAVQPAEMKLRGLSIFPGPALQLSTNEEREHRTGLGGAASFCAVIVSTSYAKKFKKENNDLLGVRKSVKPSSMQLRGQ